jgi:hypothetical protein
MAKKETRGRPTTFKPAQRRELAQLVRKHGASRARKLSAVPISMGTLLKIAREFGIELNRGRRPHQDRT